MKTLLTTTLLAAGLSLSVNANAASLTHNGYTLDTDTNIVTGGGLQWLQWDVTVGMSINQALSIYESDGWKLASNEQMERIFDAFFDPAMFGNDENVSYDQFLVDTPNSTDSSSNKFINLFGDTYKAGGLTYNYGDPFEAAGALFGSDTDKDGLYNLAYIYDEYTHRNTSRIQGRSQINKDSQLDNYKAVNFGIALVKQDIQVSAVPVPAAAWLFAPALLGFIGLRRKVKTA